MAYKVPLMVVNSPNAGSVTRYFPLMNCQGTVVTFTDSLSAETPFFEAGKITNLFSSIWTNGSTGAIVVTLVKNGIDTAMTLTIPAGGTGRYFDNVNEVSVSAGDILYIRADKSGTGNIQFGIVGAHYQTDSGKIVNKVGCMGSGSFATGTSYYAFTGNLTVVGDNSPSTTPKITVAGIIKNCHITANTNSRNSITTFRPRFNGANGNCVVTVPPMSTGLHIDDVNSDTLSVNTNLNYQRITSAGSGTFIVRTIGCEIHYPANEWNMFSSSPAGIAFNNAGFRWSPASGSLAQNGAENPATIRMENKGVFSDFHLNCSDNAATGDVEIELGVSSSYGLKVTIPTGNTGTFDNTADSMPFDVAQYINYRYNRVSGANATTLRWMSVKVVYDIISYRQKIL